MTKPTITRKQWEALNLTVATATTMLQSRIDECKHQRHDASMYEGWLQEAEAARTALSDVAAMIPFDVWFEKEEA